MAALALVKPAQQPSRQNAVQEKTKVFEIIADGKKRGISVAVDKTAAMADAVKLLTRLHRSGFEESGYRMVTVRPL